MLFGDRKRIGIEADLDAPTAPWLFGRVCIWCKDQQIGDLSQTVVLSITRAFCAQFLMRAGQRHDVDLDLLPAPLAFTFLYDALFGDSAASLKEAAELGERYGKFCVSPGGGEAFDGWIAFLIESRHCNRFIWQEDGDEHVEEMELLPGELEAVFRAFIAWVEALERELTGIR